MKALSVIFFIFPFISSGQTTKNGVKFKYQDAIRHFLTNTNRSFLPTSDTVYFMHISEADAGKLPKLMNAYHTEFISWKEAQLLLKRIVALQVYEVITAKFEKESYLIHFMPAVISKGGMERDFNNDCVVVYRQQKKSGVFSFERMICGQKAIR